ncbi:cobalamin biosynthesis protein CobW [Acuticoccus mangrovi]|uniref:Cobalamin biosynthesis protein CobW n=1 Tax=Acuticoccus mangrovi TaxID=2796142 RepID=A0A934MJ66_9HYPH|nr:cobalamin biosynthesis protein CobW [Acuticoccus mangrovi]MBJ3777956.1 cobalamin biosynthesis protein CobW [Acuticoccus mangrovi]
MRERIPVTVVTGFLGAGKTTLIRRLLEEATNTRFGLIVNEFGDMGFDGAMLSDCLDPSCDGGVVELTNGCLCCTVADDFVPALEALLDREAPPERIIVETSGLALPQPLIAAFAWPTVKPRVTVDAIVTVVDAPAVLAGRFADDPDAVEAERRADDALDHHSPLEELFDDQLRAADLVVLSKIDGLDEKALAAVRARVEEDTRGGVAILMRTGATVFGVAAAAEEDPAARDGHHSHDDDHEHDDFESRVVPASFASRAAAVAALEGLAARPEVLRIKGSVALSDRAAPLFVQAVGPRIETWFGAPGSTATGLVVIGLKGLSEVSLQGSAVAAPS